MFKHKLDFLNLFWLIDDFWFVLICKICGFYVLPTCATTQYVVSKARVAPIKTTTIPKLELEAAAMGAELASFARSEMTAHFDKIQFWTDSMATLGLIKSTKHQKLFVANRIAKILANSKSEQWNFVAGKINPADHGIRGLSLTDLKEKWLSAPKFLLENPVSNFQRDH